MRRDWVFEDGFAALANLPGIILFFFHPDYARDKVLTIQSQAERLKGVIKVSFINSEGLPEAGIDGGGVFKGILI